MDKLNEANRPKTVVFHHHLGIGDLIWHLPYFEKIAKESRDGKISVVARPSTKADEILRDEPYVEEVILYDRKPRKTENRRGEHGGISGALRFASLLKRKEFDRAIIFSDRLRYGVIAMLANIKERAGYGFSPLSRLLFNRRGYIRPYKGEGNSVNHEIIAFAIAQGFADHPIPPKMHIPERFIDEEKVVTSSLSHPIFALIVGASAGKKDWGIENYLELATALAKRGASVIFLGGPAEAGMLEKSKKRIDDSLKSSILFISNSSVMHSAALLKNCDYAVGNDTSMLNVAAAVDTPALGLFGATPPLDHDPILHAIKADGMTSISPRQVLSEIEKLGWLR